MFSTISFHWLVACEHYTVQQATVCADKRRQHHREDACTPGKQEQYESYMEMPWRTGSKHVRLAPAMRLKKLAFQKASMKKSIVPPAIHTTADKSKMQLNAKARVCHLFHLQFGAKLCQTAQMEGGLLPLSHQYCTKY